MIEQSMTHLADAKGARALLVRADITKDPAEKNATLAAAAKANPRWADHSANWLLSRRTRRSGSRCSAP